MRPTLLALLAVLMLSSCDGDSASDRAAMKERRAKRQQVAEDRLAQTPQPRVYKYADGELRIIEVPVKDFTGDLDHQRCFVWRDTEFKTATLSCGQMPAVLLGGP